MSITQANGKPTGILVLMPTRGTISVETVLCLQENLDGYPHKLLTVFRKPVDVACNELHRLALEIDPASLDFDPQYVMGIADDTYWPRGMVSRAIEILEGNPDIGVVSPLGSWRMPHSPPVCVPIHQKHMSGYGKVGILKCEPDGLIPLRYFTGGIMRRQVLDVVTAEPFKLLPDYPTLTIIGELPSPITLTEDFSYARRLTEAGVKCVTERSLMVGHVDVNTGLVYFPDRAPMIANGAARPIYDPKISRVLPPFDIEEAIINPEAGYWDRPRAYFAEQGGEDVWKVDVESAQRTWGSDKAPTET